MVDNSQLIQTFKDGLKPYIKPREQVNYIRRVLALHLAANAGEGSVSYPWALADGSQVSNVNSEIKGYQKDYIEALGAHAAIRAKFDACSHTTADASRSTQPRASGIEALEERINLLRLRQKQERLAEVEHHLNLLVAKPAASHDFLEPTQILDGVAPLPSVPREVVNSLVAEQSSPHFNLKDRVNHLEKTVLRAKLLLKQQEKLLQNARERSKEKATTFSHAERLQALSATRNELITWIEAELSKASSEDTEGSDGHIHSRAEKLTTNQVAVTEQLVQIKTKYQKYLARRRAVLGLLAQRQQISAVPRLQPSGFDQAIDDGNPPIEYLITPYIETLISSSRSLKAMIVQKSHINAAIANHRETTRQVNRHLAEESQLLPQYPMKDLKRRRSVVRDDVITKPPDKLELSNQVKPWVFAADAAKITTLETVMESVEGGQVSLEEIMKSFGTIDRLLGGTGTDEVHVGNVSDVQEDDVWLNAETNEDGKARKHTETKEVTTNNDVWSRVQGNLGLISRGE